MIVGKNGVTVGTHGVDVGHRPFIGRTVEAITLGEHSSSSHSEPLTAEHRRSKSQRGIPVKNFTEAITDNYLKLNLKGRHVANRWLRAQIEDVNEENSTLVGVIEGLT